MPAFWGRMSAVIVKEFKHLGRDRMTFGMAVMIPLVQLLLFGYAINTEVRYVPVGLVDQSGSAAGRIITQAVSATQVVDFQQRYHTPKEAEQAIVKGEIRAALVLPPDLTQRLVQHRTLGQWLIDGSDTMVSASLLQLRNMPLNQAIIDPNIAPPAATPTFDMALFFNPTRRSAVNIIPGLTAVILTMTMVLFTATAIVRERERGNMELIITTPIRPIELMIGKIVPYIFIGLMQVSIILLLGYWIFDVPVNGSVTHIYLATLLFICASLTLGLIISTLVQTQLQAMQATMFILLPSILLSGFMFPYEAMPHIAQTIAEALPATHFMRMIRAIILRGAELDTLVFDSLWLIAFTLAGITLAALRFHKRLD
ncbi:ABC transporter permease [Aestuariicella hydrocarbonica]|uniref:Transport permease protein n=1 Tax=Pseudomaricurvus hydrocarbonicus TaxID=1470433 RepID=A0A9E5T455_9GAMM|nr:ABC transporter permease [Aestuariicella hydrocarbonica]NHO67579.1 ABC transporter permease [Aestuariicella hydrocarbonica]